MPLLRYFSLKAVEFCGIIWPVELLHLHTALTNLGQMFYYKHLLQMFLLTFLKFLIKEEDLPWHSLLSSLIFLKQLIHSILQAAVSNVLLRKSVDNKKGRAKRAYRIK